MGKFAISPDVARLGGSTYELMQSRLALLFAMVQNPHDWKAPINALVNDTAELREALTDAIEHFTATTPRFDVVSPCYMRVTSDGYRNGPAGP